MSRLAPAISFSDPDLVQLIRNQQVVFQGRWAILVLPLRERREAIPAFVAHFIEHYNRLFGKDVKFVSRAAMDAVCANQWPGNVRELGHAIESAVLMTDGDRIKLDDLPFRQDSAAVKS